MTIMLIKQSDTVMKENGATCKVWEYEFPTEDLGVARCVISGRYPETGMVANTTCDQVYYVIGGKGVIHSTKKGSFEVSVGGAYWFEKGEKYWVEGNILEVALINAPTRSLRQYETYDE